MRWIDRFCQKYERYGIKNLMMYVIGLNALVFILYYMPNGQQIVSGFLFDRSLFLSGQVWRIVTFLFIPPTFSPIFVIFTLYFYYIIGRAVESEWGRMKFTVYYVFSALLTLAACFIFNASLDAYYINLSLFLAFATFYPDYQILLFFIIPIKVKYLAYFDALYFVYVMIVSPFPALLAPVIAMGAYLIFFREYLIRFINARRQRGKNVVRFKEYKRNIKHSKEYIHKCAVCGLTDTDNPNEEFRYCSLCSDYACYCSKHIFNHQHR